MAKHLIGLSSASLVGIITAVVVASSILGYWVGTTYERNLELQYRADIDSLRLQINQALNVANQSRRDSGSSLDQVKELESQLSKMSQEVSDLRTVYLEPASAKPQSGRSWSRVNDPFSMSGVVMKASASSPNGSMLYGPYITKEAMSMLGKRYTVIFRCKVGSNSFSNYVAYVDVCYDSVFVLSSMKIKASDFTSSNTWQNFQLNFTAPSNMTLGVEFRVQNLNNGITDIFIDQIQVRK